MKRARPLVVICALRGRLFSDVVESTGEQWPGFAVHLDEPAPLRTYADFWRTVWQGIGDIVCVEGDSIPPPGSIKALLDCPQSWCTHESWVGDRYLANTLGLAKFSAALQGAFPMLAHSALSRPHSSTSKHDRGLGMTKPEVFLGVVPVDRSVLRTWPELAEIAERQRFLPGSTIHPKAVDMALDRSLTINGFRPHMHTPPAPHLRYENDPAFNSKQPASRQGS